MFSHTLCCNTLFGKGNPTRLQKCQRVWHVLGAMAYINLDEFKSQARMSQMDVEE